MRLWCAYCGNLVNAELNAEHDFLFQSPCPCDMSYWQLDALEASERAHFTALLEECRALLAEHVRPGVYLQPRHGAARITPDLLDIAVLLFDHVVLCIDGAGLDHDAELLNRVIAYADAKVLTPMSLESRGALGFHDGPSDFDEPFYEVPRPLAGQTLNFSATTRTLLSRSRLQLPSLLHELACHDMAQSLERDAGLRAMRDYYAGARVAGVARPDYALLLRSWALDQLIAYVVSCDAMPRDHLTSVARGLATPFVASDRLKAAMTKGALREWYSKAAQNVPRLDDPRLILALREDIGDQSLRHVVDSALTRPGAADRSYLDLRREVEQTLDHLVDRARSLERRSARWSSAALPGLVGAVGGLVGGPYGAVIGGLGGTVVPLVSEALRRAVPSWTSYFIETP